MLEKPSLMTRIIVGKSVGFAVGLLGLLLLPYFFPAADWMLRLGALFWYTTLGAIIGVFGVFTWHPILKLPLPWWLLGTALGGWMNLLLTLFAYDTFESIMVAMFGAATGWYSPFWFVAEGALVGYVIAFCATRFGGEGAAVVGR